MKLYHTGKLEIRDPDIRRGRRNADFGQGFYLTPDMEFARRWAGTDAIVNEYELDTDGLLIHSFRRDEEWFRYIFLNRRASDSLTADLVIGPIANDTIFETFGIVSSGYLKPADAMKLLMIGRNTRRSPSKRKRPSDSFGGCVLSPSPRRTPRFAGTNRTHMTWPLRRRCWKSQKRHKKQYNGRSKHMKTVYEFTVKDRQGNDVSLSQYQGKVLLIVNTATGCGFTPHYEPLEAMYKDLKDQGFEILDFPCNQFANQAPGSEDEIHEFCTLKFGADFPQFKKIDVNGETAEPLFAFLATEKPFAGFGKGLKNAALNKFADMNNKQFGDKAYIKWNFTKFLIDREGKVVARFEPTEDMQEVRKAVAAALQL